VTLRDIFFHAPQTSVVQFQSIGCLEQYQVPFEQVKRYLPNPSTVLDWGFGTAWWSHVLRQLGHDVYAFGLWSEPGFTEILESDPCFHLTTSPEPVKLPYGDGMFDAAFSVGVLEHVKEEGGDELLSMMEIRRILKPGGLFFCSHFPNRRSWIEWVTRRRKSNFRHERLYTRKDIESFCKQAGYELLDLKLYNVLPRRILNRLPGKRSGLAASLYSGVDAVCSLFLRPLAQNWAFVARKP
jgi:SAM-dependent methyltransferase